MVVQTPLENEWLFWELGPVITYLGDLGKVFFTSSKLAPF